MNKFLILPVMFLVVGCASLQAETPQQKLYGVISDYTQLQRVAVAYKRQCDAKPVENKNGCVEHVETLRDINGKANNLIQAVSIENDGVNYLESVTNALVIIMNEFGEHINKIGGKNDSGNPRSIT